ncbi:MAG: hypothetical protein ACRC3Z_02575 [Phocaeicola sp.]
MRIRSVIKLGMVCSMLSFFIAVGFYGMAYLSVKERVKDIDVLKFVPNTAIGIFESDNLNYFLNELSESSYYDELSYYKSSSLFYSMVNSLDSYMEKRGHSFKTFIQRIVVSVHQEGAFNEQIIYFQLDGSGDEFLHHLLSRTNWEEVPIKKEKYRGKSLKLFPLGSDRYLTAYSESGLLILSYQKYLLEEVIDAYIDKHSLFQETPFSEVIAKKKMANYFKFYVRTPSIYPFITDNYKSWTDFSLEIAPDAIYLVGNTYLPIESNSLQFLLDKLDDVPNLYEDSLILSADPDSIFSYVQREEERDELTELIDLGDSITRTTTSLPLLLSVEMGELTRNKELVMPYVIPFIGSNSEIFRAFILTSQFSFAPYRITQSVILKYKGKYNEEYL